MITTFTIFGYNLCQLAPFIQCGEQLAVEQVSLPPDFGHSFSGGALKVVVQKQKEYEQLKEDSNWEWEKAKYPKINFSEHSLLGQNTRASGCTTPDYDVRLTRANGNYTYHIKITQYGLCEKGIFKDFWIITPKIPEESEVTFKTEYRRRK